MRYDLEDIAKVARMYYQLGMTQAEIAEKENLSRPTVSRMLDKAVKSGIVRISIEYPVRSVRELGGVLQERFDLKKVFVVPVLVENRQAILEDVGRAVADYLLEIVEDGLTIGVSWGTTLEGVARQLKEKSCSNVKIVQMNGGLGRTNLSTGSAQIVGFFVQCFHAQPYLLQVPAIVDSPDIVEALLSDSNIKWTLELARHAQIAIYGIGYASKDSILVRAGYFKPEEYEVLLQKGAVGDVCSRFFNRDGEVCDPELDARTIGLTLADIKNKRHSIAIAVGKEKALPVLGALRGGFVNTLFIDEDTARQVIELQEGKL